MYNTSLIKKMLFVASSIVLFYSCDKDYNTIGKDLIGDNNFVLDQYSSGVVAHNQKIGPVQSNNLAINSLGIYTDPLFGKTTANFATQLNLTALPTIGKNAKVDSVYISIPYFSTTTNTDLEGKKTYRLDSIYGENKGKIKLSIYESGYFMRTLDPATGFKDAQPFYTNENSLFDNAKKGSRLNNASDTAQNDEFFFSSKPTVLSTIGIDGKKTSVSSGPSMRLKLDDTFFQNKILNDPTKLTNSAVFKDYFRGLYFKVENVSGSEGSMALMNFAEGKITISYKEDLVSNNVTTRVQKTIVINLSGNTVSLLEQSGMNSAYSNAINNPNTVLGDENLYIKGGEGSMAVISLFNTPGELEQIRSKGWLINEANLIFNIDASKMSNSTEPNRMYLYDLTNNKPIFDYYTDATTVSNPKKNKYILSGIINKAAVTNGRGQTYKFRITNQIRNLVNNSDSTNVKLGLVVTESIAEPNFVKLKTANPFSSKVAKASVMNPLGTVLYGSHPSVPEDKKIKLQIFYTKPN